MGKEINKILILGADDLSRKTLLLTSLIYGIQEIRIFYFEYQIDLLNKIISDFKNPILEDHGISTKILPKLLNKDEMYDYAYSIENGLKDIVDLEPIEDLDEKNKLVIICSNNFPYSLFTHTLLLIERTARIFHRKQKRSLTSHRKNVFAPSLTIEQIEILENDELKIQISPIILYDQQFVIKDIIDAIQLMLKDISNSNEKKGVTKREIFEYFELNQMNVSMDIVNQKLVDLHNQLNGFKGWSDSRIGKKNQKFFFLEIPYIELLNAAKNSES